MTNRQRVLFFTVVSPDALDCARLMVSSLREFGGRLSQESVLAFVPPSLDTGGAFQGTEGVEEVELGLDGRIRRYPFWAKVLACAQAEKRAREDFGSLVWLSATCLVARPPELLELDQKHDAAFRPVHIRNVGSPGGKPLDDYWRVLYDAVGLSDTNLRVEPMINPEQLRPYYTTRIASQSTRGWDSCGSGRRYSAGWSWTGNSSPDHARMTCIGSSCTRLC